MERTSVDLLQGTLTALVLKALSRGPLHGYGIARWIEEISEAGVLVEEGSLYPTLHRLEARGWLASEWRRSATNRRVKLYRLTPQGRRQLRAELERWDQFSAAVSRVLKSPGPSTADDLDRASRASEPRERSGDHGAPASERVRGSAGAKPPGYCNDRPNTTAR